MVVVGVCASFISFYICGFNQLIVYLFITDQWISLLMQLIRLAGCKNSFCYIYFSFYFVYTCM